jgi:hypothetical protein
MAWFFLEKTLNDLPMNNITSSLHAKVHKWMDSIGFRLNGSQTNYKDNVTTNHYFFATFNFLERAKNNDPKNSKFLCFDAYGEAINVKSLLDLQMAFFETISQL